MHPTLLSARLSRRAMGVTCTVTVVGARAPLIAETCLDLVSDLEQLWSRFIPTSDVCRLNDNSGIPTLIDARTVSLLRHMVAGSEATRGYFNPALLPLQLRDGDAASLVDGRTSSVPAWADPELTVATVEFLDDGLVRLPRGLTIDAGGVGKGHAADMIVAEAVRLGAEAACVNLGGDMAISGPSPDGNGWTVEILDPIDLRTPIADVVVARGGVATSSMSARRRRGRGIERHILRSDGHQRVPPARGATVLASTATWAEMWTKAAVLAPRHEAVSALEAAGLAGLIVGHDGSISTTSTWKDFTR